MLNRWLLSVYASLLECRCPWIYFVYEFKNTVDIDNFNATDPIVSPARPIVVSKPKRQIKLKKDAGSSGTKELGLWSWIL